MAVEMPQGTHWMFELCFAQCSGEKASLKEVWGNREGGCVVIQGEAKEGRDPSSHICSPCTVSHALPYSFQTPGLHGSPQPQGSCVWASSRPARPRRTQPASGGRHSDAAPAGERREKGHGQEREGEFPQAGATWTGSQGSQPRQRVAATWGTALPALIPAWIHC